MTALALLLACALAAAVVSLRVEVERKNRELARHRAEVAALNRIVDEQCAALVELRREAAWLRADLVVARFGGRA